MVLILFTSGKNFSSWFLSVLWCFQRIYRDSRKVPILSGNFRKSRYIYLVFLVIYISLWGIHFVGTSEISDKTDTLGKTIYIDNRTGRDCWGYKISVKVIKFETIS